MRTHAEIAQENEHLRWLVDEQRQQIRDLEMDHTMQLPQQDRGAIRANPTIAQVRRYAAIKGVSERTIYRRMEAGKLTPADFRDITEEAS